MLRWTIGFAAMALACASALAQQAPKAPAPAAPAFTAVTYSLKVEDGRLSGPGADVLRRELSGAQFVLFGEDHGYAGSPEILRALAADARGAGFSYYAIEVSPWLAAKFTDVWGAGGEDAWRSFVRKDPFAVPFLTQAEDARVAGDFLGKDASGIPRLWGLDQDFAGGAAPMLDRLAVLAPNAAVRAQVDALLTEERAAQAAASMDKFLLLGATGEARIDELAKAFAGESEALSIIAAMKESAAIYRLNETNSYENNQRRVRLLTGNFLDYYRPIADLKPRIVMRMGANHVAIGTTTVNTVDLGTLASSIATLNGMKALRVAFLPAGGQQLHFAPDPKKPYVVADVATEDMKTLLDPLGVPVGGLPDGWTLIDVEASRQKMRQKGINALSVFDRFVVLGYDYIITGPDAKPATPLN